MKNENINLQEKFILQKRKKFKSIANITVESINQSISQNNLFEISIYENMFKSYKILQKKYPEKSEKEILEELTDRLGIKHSIIKMYVYRYAFYKELIENSKGIKEKDFKYLEGLHQNLIIRNMFGLDTKKMDFEWNLSNNKGKTDEIIKIKKQMLHMFPKLIDIAKVEKITSKTLRDIIRKYQDIEVKRLYKIFNNILEYSKTEEYSNDAFKKYIFA